MITMIAAMALAATPPAAPAQQMTMGQMPGMDMSKMDHSKMGQMKMDSSKMSGDGCCKRTADGKMECNMSDKKSGGDSAPKGHSGQ